MSEENFRKIEEVARREGAVKVGVAKVDDALQPHLNLSPEENANWPFAISIAVRLSQAVLDSLTDGPTPLYKWHYKQANALLDHIAFRVTDEIQKMGYRALPIAASQILDWKKQDAHLSHRHVAVAAGLGWLGRNNLLVTPEFGAQVRLVTVLTNLPLPVPEKPVPFSCGKCRRCVEECPVEALGESPQDFDFDLCFSLLDFYSRKRGLGVMICGLCVKACPGSAKLW